MKHFALTILACLLLSGGLAAQSDPFGQVDTLYIDKLTVGAGKEFILKVNMFNDERLGGLTIPLKYPKDKLEPILESDIDFTGSRIAYLATKPVGIDTAKGTILVGAIVFFEAYIQSGNGLVFSIKCRLKGDVIPGEIIKIDTTTIPPASLLFTEAASANIIPAFIPGQITVKQENTAPYFTPISDRYIAEGESLFIDIAVHDADGDPVTITNPGHPPNSAFIDNGDGSGRFVWRPDFVGPYSSTHSPYEFVFWASDGLASTTLRVTVHVVNVNRAPQIQAPAQVNAEAGDSVGIVVTGVDPDFEAVTWTIAGLPQGAAFDNENPGLISWKTDFGDSGQYAVTLIAADPYGLTDTAVIPITIAPATMFNLTVDTITTFSGKIITLNVSMKNKVPVREFNLLVNLDAALLTPLSVSKTGTRAEQFDYFIYRINDNYVQGNLRITGKAGTAAPIAQGEGPVAKIRIQISSNLLYVGNQVPVPFVFYDTPDNTITIEGGQVIDETQINYFDGYVLIAAPGAAVLGDINLNGVAFEISDAVYFSNFFISPGLFPLNEQQRLNSDINRDGLAPSVADLVLMIKIISGESQPPQKALVGAVTAQASLVRNAGGLYLRLDSPTPVAGAFFKFGGRDAAALSPVNLTAMEFLSNAWHGQTSCLLISFTQDDIPSGETSLIQLSDTPDLDVVILDADAADALGRVVKIDCQAAAAIPDQIALLQNQPNPFNPSTEIQFDLPAPTRVTLVVYNIMGQEVIRLTDGDWPAGHHVVTWDGVDEAGRPVATGIYLYRLTAGDFSTSRKMVLMK